MFLGGHHLDISPEETDEELESQGHVLSDLDSDSGQSLAKGIRTVPKTRMQPLVMWSVKGKPVLPCVSELIT